MFNVIRSDAVPPSLASKTSWAGADVIDALRKDFHDKCYICETKDPLSLNVEHFDAHQGNEEKMYAWTNLFYACARCNNLKRHHYNNLLNCTDSSIDVFRLVKHSPPLTPFSQTVEITAMDQDPRTVTSADLIKRVFTESNTGNKLVTAAYLRKRVFGRYARLVEQMNKYANPDSLPREQSDALERIKHMISPTQEYSAFLRWAIMDSPELITALGNPFS